DRQPDHRERSGRGGGEGGRPAGGAEGARREERARQGGEGVRRRGEDPARDEGGDAEEARRRTAGRTVALRGDEAPARRSAAGRARVRQAGRRHERRAGEGARPHGRPPPQLTERRGSRAKGPGIGFDENSSSRSVKTAQG